MDHNDPNLDDLLTAIVGRLREWATKARNGDLSGLTDLPPHADEAFDRAADALAWDVPELRRRAAELARVRALRGGR